MNRKSIKKGFTLAETIIVLTILGVIAMVTIPSIVTKEIESGNRATMRKAIATYEKAIETMRITEGLKGIGEVQGNETTLNGFANNDGKCTNARKYFKIAKEDTENNNPCHFKTTEGIWWDVTTMSQPIVAFDKKGKPTYLTAEKVAEKKTNLAFYMVATEKNGAFIANDVSEANSKKILVYTNIWDGISAASSSCIGDWCAVPEKTKMDLPNQTCAWYLYQRVCVGGSNYDTEKFCVKNSKTGQEVCAKCSRNGNTMGCADNAGTGLGGYACNTRSDGTFACGINGGHVSDIIYDRNGCVKQVQCNSWNSVCNNGGAQEALKQCKTALCSYKNGEWVTDTSDAYKKIYDMMVEEYVNMTGGDRSVCDK